MFSLHLSRADKRLVDKFVFQVAVAVVAGLLLFLLTRQQQA